MLALPSAALLGTLAISRERELYQMGLKLEFDYGMQALEAAL